jgi:hypothetical protein
MYNEPERKIPLKLAIGYVLLSVLIIWGSLFLTWIIHKSLVKKRQQNPRYNIVGLVQTSPQKECLTNSQLAELLGLSRDMPQNLYAFDPAAMSQKLLECPSIKKAHIRRQPPSIVHVDYQLRYPEAILADFSNVALDHDRCCFPLRPFFTPKKVPEIYLGMSDVAYGVPLDSKEALLAFKVLDFLNVRNLMVKRIDTHSAYAKSLGLQEVVVVLQDGPKTRFLRLAPYAYEHALESYLNLKPTLDQINPSSLEQVVDLRSPQIALVK